MFFLVDKSVRRQCYDTSLHIPSIYKMAKALGIEFTSASLSAKGFQGFLDDLVEKTGGNTDALAQLFGGVEALIPVMALSGQAGVDFAAIMEQMADKAGATEDAFAKMAASPGFQAKRLFGSLTAEAIEMGTAMSTQAVPALKFLADNAVYLSDVMDRLVVAAALLGTYMAVSWVAAFVAANGAVGTLTIGMNLLSTAIVRTGFGLLIIGAAELVVRFMKLADAVGGFGNAMVYVEELGREVWSRIGIGAGALQERFKATAAGVKLAFINAFDAILSEFARMTMVITAGLSELLMKTGQSALAASVLSVGASVTATVNALNETSREAVEVQQALVLEHSRAADQMMKDAMKPFYFWIAMNDVIDAAKKKASGDFGTGTGTDVPAVPELPQGQSTGGGAETANTVALRREVEELERLKDALRQGDEAYKAMAETIEIENMLREQKLDPMSAEGKAVAELVRQYNYLSEAIDTIMNADQGALSETDRTRRLERFQDLGDDLRSNIDNPALRLQAQYEEQLAIVDQYEQAYTDKTAEANEARLEIERQYQDAKLRLALSSGEQAAGALAGAFKTMMGEQSSAYKAMFAIQQAFVIATASLNIAKAMSEALSLPFPANLSAWGVVASNAAQIMTSINSVALGFKEGGYTGPGGVNDVAGVVHRGEVVWSQADVARYGGWQNVDAMRRGMPMAANDNGAAGRIEIGINVTVDDDGRIQAYVTEGMNEAVNASVTISDQRTKARMDAKERENERPRISARKVA